MLEGTLFFIGIEEIAKVANAEMISKTFPGDRQFTLPQWAGIALLSSLLFPNLKFTMFIAIVILLLVIISVRYISFEKVLLVCSP